ncbi:MAG: C/D box methylation guide ribonucleoprotein complex aNOP56 subunit [Candidatus Bathyarchaeota archaeon]|nr:C/D box methylation guide ribonucleoprotein complex aNOP56 subunit [Candidatus Bathyarchaeota archaeon]
MKAWIVGCSFGVLAFNEKNELIAHVLFPKNPQKAAETLMKIEAGKIVDEVRELVERLKKDGYETFVFENSNLAKEVQEKLNIKVEVSKPSPAGDALRSDMEGFAIRTGFVENSMEFSLWTHKVSMEIAKLRVKGAVEKRDLIVAQAIQTLDDLDRTINLFMGRIREWYGIHFPELDRLVDKHETYARLVSELGNKENFTVEKLEKEDVSKAKAEQIAKVAQSSMGADITETDLTQIQALCRNVLGLYQLRQNLEQYLDMAMEEVAPNTKALVGSLLGARLIALSGGLTNLAKMPASTIQVLGAEKALFRSLKTGTKPPKHGIIFQHTFLHEAKKWHRGKIARALAGKLAIAVRADAFGGRHLGEELKAGLEKRIGEIHEKYAEPPPIPERKPKREKKRRKWKRAGKG